MIEAHMKMISLSGENYPFWKGKMKALLFVKNMHLPVFGTQKPNFMSDEVWGFDHECVCGFIRHIVDESIYNLISHETHVGTLWQTLESFYASKSGSNKLYLLKSFVELKYKDGAPFTKHLSEFQGRCDQLLAVGINFDDDMLGLFLLITLPDSWETFRFSMISAASNGIVPLQMAKTSALNEEMRRKVQGISSQSEVLVTENRGRSQKMMMKGDRDESKSNSRSRYKNVECHYFHRIGHILRNCFLWKKDSKDKKGKQKEKDHDDDRVTTATSDYLVILYDPDSLNLVSDESM
ncbi:hypothetical protein JHK87_024394 [Glycine soja]|nr:hypothetical protein JHK87_024394 [Glycine soja]